MVHYFPYVYYHTACPACALRWLWDYFFFLGICTVNNITTVEHWRECVIMFYFHVFLSFKLF